MPKKVGFSKEVRAHAFEISFWCMNMHTYILDAANRDIAFMSRE